MLVWIKTTWEKINNYFTDVNSEYKLVNTTNPELFQLKSAHQQLLQAYAESLNAVSRLSFLVKISEVRRDKESATSGILQKLVWSTFSPLRLFVWRPVINLYIEAHIYKKLKELTAAYTLAYFISHKNYLEEHKTYEWYEIAKKECEQFMQTLSFGRLPSKLLNYFFFSVLGLVTVAWGASNLYDLAFKLLSASPPALPVILIGKFIVFTILLIPIVLVFTEAAFFVKREIFLNINANKTYQESIYKLENSLFILLGRGKSREFPIDYSTLSFYFLMIIGYIWLFHLAISKLPRAANVIICDYTWCLLLPYIFILFIEVVLPWSKRVRDGEM